MFYDEAVSCMAAVRSLQSTWYQLRATIGCSAVIPHIYKYKG